LELAASALPNPGQRAASKKVRHKCQHSFARAAVIPATQEEDRHIARHQPKEKCANTPRELGIPGATNLARHQHASDHGEAGEPEWPQEYGIDGQPSHRCGYEG
jgi:hypothetical protein